MYILHIDAFIYIYYIYYLAFTHNDVKTILYNIFISRKLSTARGAPYNSLCALFKTNVTKFMHDRIKLINAVRLTYFKEQSSHCNNNQHSGSLLKYKYFIFTHKINHTTIH